MNPARLIVLGVNHSFPRLSGGLASLGTALALTPLYRISDIPQYDPYRPFYSKASTFRSINPEREQ